MSMSVTLELTYATQMPHASTLMEVMTVIVTVDLWEMASIAQVRLCWMLVCLKFGLLIALINKMQLKLNNLSLYVTI